MPRDKADWNRVFLGLMGSPDAQYGRQLNGMGGGISSLSKICVVEPSHPGSGTHVDYTFVQVGIRDNKIDYSGNCGNLSAMIGVFALTELGIPGLNETEAASSQLGSVTVRSLNTNTNKVVTTNFPVDASGNPKLDLDQIEMAGVPGKASAIQLNFVSPGGARTGKVLPTGGFQNSILVERGDLSVPFSVSLVDITNPTVLIRENDLRQYFKVPSSHAIDYSSILILDALESIRKKGAVLMHLDPEMQAQPKIAILSSPDFSSAAHIQVHALSMGALHKAVPMTVGICIGVAAKIKGTIAWEIASQRQSSNELNESIRISHPSGTVDIVSACSQDGSTVDSAGVLRTGRRLMKVGHNHSTFFLPVSHILKGPRMVVNIGST